MKAVWFQYAVLAGMLALAALVLRPDATPMAPEVDLFFDGSGWFDPRYSVSIMGVVDDYWLVGTRRYRTRDLMGRGL